LYAGTGRSLPVDETTPLVDEVAASSELVEDYSVANLFDSDGHFSAITTHHQKRQTTNRKRYVLFILDSSGSVGSTPFTTMINVLSDLLPLFCGNVVYGVMSYGSKIERDICFNCDQTDRTLLQQAIKSIKYHNGGSTRSGDAVRCACNYMLTRSCGYYNEEDSVTDVIFITDGHSNRGENVCTAVNCIPKRVNVISIGVGNYIDYDELECIEGDNGAAPHIFDVANIQGLLALKTAIINQLITTGLQCQSLKK